MEPLFFYYSEPIAQEENAFFYKQGTHFDWQTINDLKRYRIGGIIGYNYGEALDKAEKSGMVILDRTRREELNFKKLLKGRLDAVINNLETGYDIINHYFTAAEAQQIIHHPKSLNARPLYLLISKKCPQGQQLRDRFNRGLAKLHAAGKIKQYYAESRRGEYKK